MSISQTEFDMLREEWIRDTGFMSSPKRRAEHWACQELISRGKAAIPYMLQDMKDNETHWLWALHEIAREDPAHGETTIFGAMEKWLAWGKEQGYIND